ncbi:MAG: VOC family protein [Rhodocyclaceae bacterium]|nr:VOC family protein [Rhodocyclaceae bacterium]MBK9624208.1 VOC family protein [Rhodocyclaceae bacterium]MBL0075047.1 VOC family protein [Rhodocyclaceae bacterium]MBP6108781.1 VOC family protein [Rhodocyclaceae bacterium]
MIGYVTVGTNDFPRAVEFYEKLFGSLGATRIFENENGVIWTNGPMSPGFGVMKPFNGQPATFGNGTMIAIVMDTKANVDKFYKLAISLGATDDGPPGQRSDAFYAAYFRDFDGNKIAPFYMS